MKFQISCLRSLVLCLGLAPGVGLAVAGAGAGGEGGPQVGSKRFTESYLLGAIVTETLIRAGLNAEHRPGLGNTAVLEQALSGGAIDVYPEYTGTIVRELLKREGRPDLEQLNAWLVPRGLKAAVPLGFDNSYALALRRVDAERLGLVAISDLSKPAARALRLGLSHEFLGRVDGWPALRRAYGLPFDAPSGLDHGLAYAALSDGRVDLIDVYTTDARIERSGLTVLKDDRRFFPSYDALLLMRAGFDAAPLQRLAGRIDAQRMTMMNAAVEIDGRSYAEVAREFVAGLDAGPAAVSPGGGAPGAGPQPVVVRPRELDVHAAGGKRPGLAQRIFADDLWRLTRQHLLLVLVSLFLAVGVGVPLGVMASRQPVLAQVLIGAVSILQTVPSLAMLAFLIVIVGGIGFAPAVIALFLYALLPIMRNTLAGLSGVAPGLLKAAQALGLSPWQQLRHVELPLAAPSVIVGVQTAATINVGTATMAAFVGAGGYGERIVTGLALNDSALLLAGALPAAGLALAVQAAFELILRVCRRSRV
jgi:osmoprotectant transport system permease protein